MAVTELADRRRASRVDLQTRVEIDRVHPPTRLPANSVNLSEGGICVRLEESLELSSRVRLRLFLTSAKRPLTCEGRVAWVVQRMDLRTIPPLLYDVGLEFVEPGRAIRQFASQVGLAFRRSEARGRAPSVSPATINGRLYIPKLEKAPSSGLPWHLSVWVDGAPCFSHRYPSQRHAVQSWEQFKRRMTRSLIPEVYQ